MFASDTAADRFHRFVYKTSSVVYATWPEIHFNKCSRSGSDILAKNHHYMKLLNLSLFLLTVSAVFFCCTKSKTSAAAAAKGVWANRASLTGPVGAGVSFTVNNRAYVGTGLNPQSPSQKLTSLFQYTPAAIPATPKGFDSAYGYWTQMQDFPGQARSNAVGFNIGNIGYIGSGLASDGKTALADFYAYNPTTNSWAAIDSMHTEAASFPRYDAVAFGFDTTAYVLTGTDGKYYFGDVWRYSPAANTWIREPNYPGSPRSAAVAFVYQGQGYLVTGFTPGDQWAKGTQSYDFWRFTPETDTSVDNWVRLNDIYSTGSGAFDAGYTDIIRDHASSFLILGQPDGDKAYITLGSNNGTDINSTWEYDFASDVWTPSTPFPGTARASAVSFTLSTSTGTGGVASTRGFVAAGLNQGNTTGFTDCYEFSPSNGQNQQ